jgi:hypothetical protein
MDLREAERVLEDAEVVPVVEAGVSEAKRLQSACLAAEIPVLLGRDDHCTKGCSPKVQLLVREQDIPRVTQLMRSEWIDLARREGTLDAAVRPTEAADEEHPPCPACGTAAPLVDGACSDCGLTLG